MIWMVLLVWLRVTRIAAAREAWKVWITANDVILVVDTKNFLVDEKIFYRGCLAIINAVFL